MPVLLTLLFATCCARIGLRDVGSLLRKLSCLIDDEMKRSMLDSPDHCEASFAEMRRDSSLSSQTDISGRCTGGSCSKPSADFVFASKDGGILDVVDKPSSDPVLEPRDGVLGTGEAKIAMDGAETVRMKTGENLRTDRYTVSGVEDGMANDIVSGTLREQASIVRPTGTVDAATNKILKKQISSLGNEQKTLEKVKALRENMDDQDHVLVPQKPASEKASQKQYNWSPKVKKMVVPGIPRKLKVVKIVPVPIDDDGTAWT